MKPPSTIVHNKDMNKTKASMQYKNDHNTDQKTIPDKQVSGKDPENPRFYGLMPIIWLSLGMIFFLIIMKLIMDLFLVK